MPISKSSIPRAQRAGHALIEILISVTLFAVVMLSSMAMIESGQEFSRATIAATYVEDLSQQMLFRIERELAVASGEALPSTWLRKDLTTAATSIDVASTLGFPPTGTLVIDRGTPAEERVSYTGHGAGRDRFDGAVRGRQCTAPNAHGADASDPFSVMWVGLAMPIDDQVAPGAADYDGVALDAGTATFFRGDGTGFSYRVPIDPTGGRYVLNGNDLHWGAEVSVVGPTRDGWAALYYEPKDTFDEARAAHDLNGDGDFVDLFDVGQIRRIRWDTTDPTRSDDVGMGPSNVVQERCEWGGDLDSDGFDDPLFLWDRERNTLHARLFVLGHAGRHPILRKVETVVFLRNEPEF